MLLHRHLQMYGWIQFSFKSDPQTEMMIKLQVNYWQLIPAASLENPESIKHISCDSFSLIRCVKRQPGGRQGTTPPGGCCTTGEKDTLPDTSSLTESGTGSLILKAGLILLKVSQRLTSFNRFAWMSYRM